MRKIILGLLFSLWAFAAQAQVSLYPFFIVGDMSPGTLVWKSAAGGTEANTSADYQAFVGSNSSINAQIATCNGACTTPLAKISGTQNNGGLIELLVANTFYMVTGDVLVVANNGAVSNGTWTVTVVDANCNGGGCRVDLQGSTWSGSSESGGNLGGGTKIATMAGMLAFINQTNQGNIFSNQGVNPITSAVSVTLTNPVLSVQAVSMTAPNKVVTMPQANLFGSIAIGQPIVFENTGTVDFAVNRADGFQIGIVPVSGFMTVRLGNNANGHYAPPEYSSLTGIPLSAGNLLIDQGPAGAFGSYTMSGDCSLSISTLGAITCPTLNGISPGALFSLNVGGGLASSGGNLNNNATEHISFQPGLLTSVINTKAVFYKFSKASTVDNLEASAISFSCVGNPTVTMYECGTDASCASPTTIGSATVTGAGTAVDGTVSNAAIGAGHYVAFAISAGTCASLDVQASAQVHQN
jgi:hypothetical protein